jgi:hypothetical protein
LKYGKGVGRADSCFTGIFLFFKIITVSTVCKRKRKHAGAGLVDDGSDKVFSDKGV